MWDCELIGFGVRCQRRARVYVLKYAFDRRQRFFTIGRHGPLSADQARREAMRLLGLVAQGKDPATQRDAKGAATTVAELCDRYLADGPALKPLKKASSWHTDRSNIERHIKPLLGVRSAHSLTQLDVARFQSNVAEGRTARDERTGKRGRAIVRGGRGTAARSLAVLGAILAFAVRAEIIESNPARGVALLKGVKRGRFLSPDEWQRLGRVLEVAEAQARQVVFLNAIRLLVLTGCRKSEVTNLAWEEVDLANGYLHLSRSKTGPKSVVLGRLAVELLSDLKARSDSRWVFPSTTRDGPMVGLQKAWEGIREAADLSGVRLHDLRHSFASAALSEGSSLYLVGQILGHRQARTTEGYAHLRADPIRAVADQAGSKIATSMGMRSKPT